MVRTGAYGYTKFGWETGYGQGSSAVNKRFGIQERVTGWTLNNNIQTLSVLNQSVYEKYAYGQQSGSISLGFVLSNPYILVQFMEHQTLKLVYLHHMIVVM